jgi:hypothetical protein
MNDIEYVLEKVDFSTTFEFEKSASESEAKEKSDKAFQMLTDRIQEEGHDSQDYVFVHLPLASLHFTTGRCLIAARKRA